MKFLVIAYDVVSDKRRTRLVKFLEEYGRRVNYSVFEVEIEKEKLDGLSQGVQERIHLKKDCVLIYELCGKCIEKRNCIGLPKRSETPEVALF